MALQLKTIGSTFRRQKTQICNIVPSLGSPQKHTTAALGDPTTLTSAGTHPPMRYIPSNMRGE